MVSVLILTHNEEINLPDCLKSVAWSDDILVFDSFSSDRTVEIARSLGARVQQHAFENYGAQREAARNLGGFKHEWVLAVDADERVDGELADEVRAIAAGQSTHAAYRMRRKDFFQGRWIRHATLYPSWFVRFLRHRQVRYDPREVHEYPTVDGTVGELKGHLLHHSFNKGLDEWWTKHRAYSGAEARAELAALRRGGLDLVGLFDWRDPVRHRQALKALSFRMPARPVLRFLYMYVLRCGLLDGGPGYRYCRMLAEYERLIVRNLRNLKSVEAEP
ncbi:MAG: glycosyltransferase family 2 protein [Candidatus Coatesbacteria bacterium]